MTHLPPSGPPRPPSSAPRLPGDDTDTDRKPVRPPPGRTLLVFLIGFGVITAFVVIRYVLPGHTSY